MSEKEDILKEAQEVFCLLNDAEKELWGLRQDQFNQLCHAITMGLRLIQEVKKLRKQIPKDSRNMKTWKLNFENVWNQYPEKKGKHNAWLHFKAQVRTPQALINITKALRNYKKDMVHVRKSHPERPWLHGETWFNHRWEDFIDYQAPEACAIPYKPNKVETPNRADCVPPEDLQKLVKDFNKGLKAVPRASTKFVEPK